MNKLRSKNGSVLLLVMVALLLITTLYSAVVLYGSYHRRLALQDVMDTQAFYMAESGIEAAVAKLNQESNYGLAFSGEVDSLKGYEVNVRPFGAYLLCESKGKAGTRDKTLRCLIGAVPEDKFDNAINLGGQDYPLTLAGRTTIIGDVLVSPSGVLPGRFKGKRFGGKKLVFGEIKKSPNNRLPPFDDSIIEQFQSEIDRIAFSSSREIDKTFILDDANWPEIQKDSLIEFNSGLIISINEKSLNMTGRHFKVNGNLVINEISRVYGYGIVEVEGEVQIEGNCYLKDLIILVDNDVEIKGDAVYAAQLIAKSKVEITENATLSGNGVVVCLGEIADDERCVYLSGLKPCQGSILCDLENINANKPGHRNIMKTVDISPGSSFSGVIFNTGYSKVSGNISGNLSTGSFYMYDSPTVFINWLVDAAVESGDRLETIPAVFAGGTGYAKIGGL
ncbi:MAG: hypothetical protein GY839_02820 [candidate division Zixibacteria bacterium]|nr:hypothetical protein [candidate division Zixibacteria bacterium]